jgi:hypothetical protein
VRLPNIVDTDGDEDDDEEAPPGETPFQKALELMLRPSAPDPAAAGAPAPVVPVPVPVPVTVPLNLPRLPRNTPRLGAQRENDRLVRWDFWIKPGARGTRLNNQEDNAKVRSTFGGYIVDRMNVRVAPSPPVSHWTQRLEVSVSQHLVQPVGDNQLTMAPIPVTRVTCTVYMPIVSTIDFVKLFDADMRRYGLGSMMRRWLGIIGAAARTEGEQVTANEYGTWRELQLNPAARPADPGPFQVTNSHYNESWKVYTLEDDPLPITIGHTGPQSATDVPVEWCFWIKGVVRLAELEFGNRAREHLSRWFRNNILLSDDRDVATPLNIPMRLQVEIRPYTSNAPGIGAPQVLTRCEFQLYLPTTDLAQAFVTACRGIARVSPPSVTTPDSFAELDLPMMRQLVGVTGARSTHFPYQEDFPTIRTGELRRSKRLGLHPYELTRKPESVRAFNAWQTHTLVPLAPIEQSAHEAYWEQARNERLEEPTIDPMVPHEDSGESRDVQVAHRSFDSNDPEYAVTIHWRFWLKGSMNRNQFVLAQDAMRLNFATYVDDTGAADLRPGNNHVNWYQRVRVEIFQRDPRSSLSRDAHTLLRCECSVKVSQQTADQFDAWALNDRGRYPSWAAQVSRWHNYGSARVDDGGSPRRDLNPRFYDAPVMTAEDYARWPQWASWFR